MNRLERAKETVRKHGMVFEGDRVIAAVSRGLDSVALLHVLHDLQSELRLRLEVAHLQYGIQGDEAVEDARFVVGLAKSMDFPFHIREGDLPRIKSNQGKGNIEALAQEARYRFFVSIAQERGIENVATAHTLDVQAETVLM